MTKTIQMIKTSEDNNLWLIGYNEETKELTFRTSRVPEQLQTEKIIFKDDMVHTNLYFFHVGFLQKFINENDLKAERSEADEA